MYGVGQSRVSAAVTTRLRCSNSVKNVTRQSRPMGKRSFQGGLCTSITAKTIQAAKRQIQKAEHARVDTIEFRLDYLQDFQPDIDLLNLFQSTELPYIVTYRPTWEGGHYDGSEKKRLMVLKMAAAMGAPLVDIELAAAESFFSGFDEVAKGTEIILSHHDYRHTADLQEMTTISEKMYDNGADIAKIATTVGDITDCKRLIDLLREQTRPAIVLGMGEKGVMTRVLAPKYGGFLTFGALASGEKSAPGQPTVEALREMYRINEIRPSTKVYGVIGNPIAHSKSPLFHNACLRTADVDAVFLPLLVDDFDSFLNTFTDSDFAGYSVTVPHKETAWAAADALDEVTKGIGACNTLVRDGADRFVGYNTDWSAAIDIIEEGLRADGEEKGTLKGKTMVVVGAGGVAKAIAYGGASKGARVIVANRTVEKAKMLAERIPGCSTATLEDLNDGSTSGDVLVNGTSLGMEPNEDTTPVAKEALGNFSLVFDAVYTPKETRLLKEAAEMGCKTTSGVGMFVGQARRQFELFTGKKAPTDVIERLFPE